MVFLAHRSDSNVNLNVKLDGVTINKVKSCRYLGIIVYDELKWTEHISHIYHNLLNYVGIFYKSRSKIPASVMTDVYYAFVHAYVL